jgi:hypothetical protein
MPLDTQEILKQIDEALKEVNELQKKSKYEDCSDQPDELGAMVTNRMASTIDRLAPPGSHHKRNLAQVLSKTGHAFIHLHPLKGALLALRRDYELGHLQSVTELVHADTFASFMEMADHLYEQGYKDAAAVVAGSVLEQHLRELSNKNGIPIEISGKRKKADTLNSDLAGAAVYSKLDQKNVTSWLGLRNAAAHGNYSEYTPQQVRLMIDAILDFIARFPA